MNLFIKSPSHALIILGPVGSGRTSVAKLIAKELIGANQNPSEQIGNIKSIGDSKNSVGIDEIRELKTFFRLKSTGAAKINRVATIHADNISDEAQNSLLKLLEEPPLNSLIILTASSENSLRPTILSRSQKLFISRPSQELAVEHFSKLGKSKDDIVKTYLLSNGNMGLMSSILSSDSESELVGYVEDAKKILKSTRLSKLAMIDEMVKDKEHLSDRLYALKRVTHAAMKQSIQGSSSKSAKAWYHRLNALNDAEIMLNTNVNIKLTLTNLFLNL